MKEEEIDHCSLFFEKIGDVDISGCCEIHDEEYEDPNIPRKVADQNLRLWIDRLTSRLTGVYKLADNIVYSGVRVFGWIFWYKWRLRLLANELIRAKNQIYK